MTFDLASLGWDADFAYAYADVVRGSALPQQRPARVARVDRGVCTVFSAAGTDRASLGGGLLARCGRDSSALPCAGDWVVVRTWPDQRTTIEAVLPRRTRILRATAGRESKGQVLAANLDVAAVVEPMAPAPDLAQIERLLALAIASGAEPLVILTKADLVTRPGPVARQIAGLTGGVDVVTVSARRGTGLDRLRPLVTAGRTLGLLGPSGSGKSTMVNALAGASVMATREIRRADGRGRHTTTYRALIPLPGGGAILDTPGVRAVGMFADPDQSSETGLDQVFSEIDRLAAGCRFADCGHDREPDCAVREALATGELSARRLDSWRRLHRELDREARRRDLRLATEARALWKRRDQERRVTRRVGHLRG
ncbi:ribosome small subunit-dependent GTPase A [Rugosimonospora africana]|uniref:Small ribosomal subunit biogenesis GTPase RsgA n=1 Tax=Rugosimonospora africana TaxID=556532 RepID=A0A8J3QY53_9ACTN|nr:ribosome small subunit-dependent GTPase A [Rugosimonospora africana]GIH18277.1 putative ribosome biogenesis GTPase RsgA [Rugosimonospora africana]